MRARVRANAAHFADLPCLSLNTLAHSHSHGAQKAALQIEIPAGPAGTKNLHEAVASMNLTEVRKAVSQLAAQHGLLESQDELQRTPLIVAAKRGDASIVSYLLYLGANPDVEAKFGITPSGWAAHNAHFNADQKEAYTGHPLSWAIRNNHFLVARILLSHRSTHEVFQREARSLDIFGESILHACARSGSARMMRMILAFDTWDLNQVDVSGRRADEVAANPVVREALEEARAAAAPAAAAKAQAEASSLHEALKKQQFFALRALLDAGSDINELNAEHETPLLVMAKEGSATIVSYLMARNADPNIKDSFGYTPLHWACLNDHVETVRILLSHKSVHARIAADPAFGVSVNGDTVTHMASRSGNVDLVRFVLSFDTFLPCLSVRNNQKQVPKDVADVPAVHDVCKATLAALERGTIDEPLMSPSLMTPMAQRFPRLCAKCLSPPDAGAESGAAVYSCSCMALICSRCLSDSVLAATRSGAYPSCVNRSCGHRLPLHVISAHLPSDAQLSLVAVLVNEQFSIDATYKATCRVCSRVNSLQSTFDRGTSSRYTCTHCSVFLCAVCNQIFPETPDDDDIHRECQSKFPFLATFNALNVVIARASEQPIELSDADLASIVAADARVAAKPSAAEQRAAAAALIKTMRVRAAIIGFARSVGKPKFVRAAACFDWQQAADDNYFVDANGDAGDSGFPWSDETMLPSWLEYEPEACWNLYASPAALRWVNVSGEDVPNLDALRSAD